MLFWKRKNNAESSPDIAIVGLGNPGDEYASTRHNIGWMVLAELAKKYDVEFSKSNGQYYQGKFKIGHKEVLLAFPMTYMNNSGKAITHIIKHHQIELNNICVVVDEYNFPVGKIHLKGKGSHGGHNGLRSIIDETGSNEFWRLRCGIDKNFGQGELVEYVLSEFEEHETQKVNEMIDRSLIAIKHMIKHDLNRAMSDINSEKIFNNDTDKAKED